jgi:hypothetical protein
MEKSLDIGKEFEPSEYFEPIDQAKIDALKQNLIKEAGLDVTNINVDITKPGEFLFDLYEAQTKLYNKIGDWNKCIKLLKKSRYTFDPIPPNADKIMRRVALENGVELNGRMPGFIYNIGGHHIIYFSIAPEDVVPMAQKYAGKEHDEIEFYSQEVAKKYLQELAEKYFYHEIGHSVYLHMLPEEIQELWDDYVNANEQLREGVIRVQKDKHPTVESIPVGNEAFADIFAEIITNGRMRNRLGEHTEATELARSILIKL